MANKIGLSAKRIKINQANTVMVGALAISSFLVVFSLVASKALLSQRAYQARVIDKKQAAVDQLETNLKAIEPLVNAYKVYTNKPQNVLGGNPEGDSGNDGDNAKIVLDALPSKYDFPAMATSLEKLMAQKGVKINSIQGTDQEAAQAGQGVGSSPKPVEMPFEINATAKYPSIQSVVLIFEKSIRPFYIDKLKFSGSDGELTLDMTAKTYYQPERDLTFQTEVVK